MHLDDYNALNITNAQKQPSTSQLLCLPLGHTDFLEDFQVEACES